MVLSLCVVVSNTDQKLLPWFGIVRSLIGLADVPFKSECKVGGTNSIQSFHKSLVSLLDVWEDVSRVSLQVVHSSREEVWCVNHHILVELDFVAVELEL